MSGPLVLAIDQGTSSTKALLVDGRGEIVGRAQAPVSLATPEPGWVQQDGEEIWSSVRRAASEALDADTAKRVVSVGLSTQRESCVIWDRRTGEALTPVLSWQDQRTEGTCAALRAAGHGATIRRRSGLPLDPMFSAAKARWLLDRLPQGQARAKAGEICIGTIDAFLLSRFGGEAVVEAGNASRTQLFDVVGANGTRNCSRFSMSRSTRFPASLLRRDPFRKRVTSGHSEMGRPSARCWPIRIRLYSLMEPSGPGPSRRRKAPVPPSWALWTDRPRATATLARPASASRLRGSWMRRCLPTRATFAALAQR